MKVFQKLLAFYIDSSLHVAFAVVAFMGITGLEFGISLPIEFWSFVFLGAISGYNFIKYSRVAGLHHRSLTTNLRAIQVFSAFAFLLLLLVMLSVKTKTIFTAAGFGILTLLYAVPFYHHKNLRMFSGLKIIIVAVVWAGVTVILPLVEVEMDLSQEVWITFIQRILFVIVLIMPFEIRDLNYDAPSLHTLPQSLGVRKTKLLGGVILVVTMILELWKPYRGWGYIFSYLIFVICLTVVLFFSNKKQNVYFSSFWVEALPIFWWAMFVLFSWGGKT